MKRAASFVAPLALLLLGPLPGAASDHLDAPSVVADPTADIGDLYAWMAPDGGRLELVMTVVGHRFSDEVLYAFHVDSGPRLGETRASIDVVCRFDTAGLAECWAGDVDYARGDASTPAGIEGKNGHFRVFAGLRDDPFFNNVKGTRAAMNAAAAALHGGATVDTSGCVHVDAATSAAILEKWRHTGDGPATNLLAGWTSAAIVVSVDVGVVNAGGPLLGVWGGTYTP